MRLEKLQVTYQLFKMDKDLTFGGLFVLIPQIKIFNPLF